MSHWYNAIRMHSFVLLPSPESAQCSLSFSGQGFTGMAIVRLLGVDGAVKTNSLVSQASIEMWPIDPRTSAALQLKARDCDPFKVHLR